MRRRFQGFFDRPLYTVLTAVAVGAIGFAAGFVALEATFGVLPVVLGTFIGLAVVALLWYWARLLRQLDQLMPIAELHDERNRYENALALIANRGSRLVVHHSAVITYEMGTTGDLDRISEDYVTSEGEIGHPLLWFEVRVNVIGSDVPQLGSFRELRDVLSYQTDGPSSRAPLSLLSAGNTGRGIRGLAIFNPEIGVIPRTWGWSAQWPVWEPLRRTGQDSVGFEVLPAVTFEHLQVRVVLPEIAIKPKMQPTEVANPYTPRLLTKESGDHRWQFVVELDRPGPGYYLWTVTVEGFETATPQQLTQRS